MNPVVGLRLTQLKLQPVHDLQRGGLLVDQDEQELVFTVGQGAFAPPPARRWRAFPS